MMAGKRCFQKAISLNATDEVAGVALGDIYEQAGQYSLALSLYRQATGTRHRGGFHALARQLPVALTQIACVVGARVVWAWRRLGFLQLKLGKERKSRTGSSSSSITSTFEEALQALQMVLRSDKLDVECWVGLGQAYHSLGKFVASLKVLAHAITLIFPSSEPTNASDTVAPSSQTIVAGSSMATGINATHLHGLWSAAAAAAAAGDTTAPFQPPAFAVDATYQIALVKHMLGLNNEAIVAHKTILQFASENYVPSLHGLADALLSLARQEVRQGLFGRAADTLMEAVWFASKSLAVQDDLECSWKLLGDSFAFAYQLPLHELHRAAHATPDSHPAHSASGTARETFAFFCAKAIDAYTRALGVATKVAAELSGSDGSTGSEAHLESEAFLRHDIGVVHWHWHRITRSSASISNARQSLQQAIQLKPSEWRFWFALGLCHFDEPPLQQHLLITAIELLGDKPVRGRSSVECRESDGSLTFDSITQVDGGTNQALVWSALALLYGSQHRDAQKGWELAENALEISREMDAEFALPYAIHAGMVLDRQASVAEHGGRLPVPSADSTAFTWFQRAVALNLPSIESNLGLGHSALAVGDAAAGLFALLKFVEFYPEHVQARNLLALAQESHGQFKAALSTLEQAISLASAQKSTSNNSNNNNQALEQQLVTLESNRARLLCRNEQYQESAALYDRLQQNQRFALFLEAAPSSVLWDEPWRFAARAYHCSQRVRHW